MQKIFYCQIDRGFTIVEVMVAMVVLAIGLLGMAGMTLMVIKGGTDASRMTYATNLSSDKMEALKDVTWADLGSVSEADCEPTSINYPNALLMGCVNQKIVNESGLNQQGSTTSGGPYPFTRRWVICTDTGGATAINDSNRCDVNLRPSELGCNVGSTEVQTNEKKIKILVTWLDRTGRCHKIDMKSIQVNLQ